MEDKIITAIRKAIAEEQNEVLRRAIEAVLRADDYGHKREEILILFISETIRTTITDNAETISPEATVGAGVNGIFLGQPATFLGCKIAVQSQNIGQYMIALISRCTLPDAPPDEDTY